jgi:sporulation protein YlmC with PRC-barrel domain/uncharacterized membrane protein YqjE
MADASAFDWEGETVLDRDGEKVGKIEEIFLVEETGRPEWALIKVGRLKGRTTLVPLTRARPSAKGVAVHVGKDVIVEAPEVDADGEPSEQQVDALYRHYGIEIPATGSQSNGGGHAAEANGNGASSHGAGDLRDAPIADVAKTVAGQAQTLLGQEVRLAKAEMGEKVKEVGIGAGMAGGAGYVAYLASIALMLCLIFALAEVMPTAVAALIVAVVLAAIAGLLALKAKQRIQQAGPPIPEQTVESVKQTIETVKEGATWGLGQTR